MRYTAHQIFKIIPGRHFTVVYDIDKNPMNIDFKMHNHDDIYEIVLVLAGDCEFYVEGNSYTVKPLDMCFTRPSELHLMTFCSDNVYERIVIYLQSDFFEHAGRKKYLDIFLNRKLGTGNLVSHDIAGSAAASCAKRVYGYFKEGALDIAEGAVCELLYIMNRSKDGSDGLYASSGRVRDIIIYINSHLTEKLSLDMLAAKFFTDKHYLCRIFKKYTGYTINQYINYKRILLVQEMHRNGQTLLQASMNAGFNSYAHFYKMYVKQTGNKPKYME